MYESVSVVFVCCRKPTGVEMLFPVVHQQVPREATELTKRAFEPPLFFLYDPTLTWFIFQCILSVIPLSYIPKV